MMGEIDPAAYIRYYIRFLTFTPKVLKLAKEGKITRNHKQRANTWLKWDKFLGTIDTQRLYFPEDNRGLEEVEAWLERQVSQAMAVVVKARGRERLNEIIREGEKRLPKNRRYQRILQENENENSH